MSTDEIMTPEEVMALLKVGRTKLYDLIDQGLPFHSLSPSGRTKRFLRAEVQAWFEGRGISRQPLAAEQGEQARRKGRPPKSSIAEGPRKWIRR